MQMKRITILLLASLLIVGNLTLSAKDDKKKSATELGALSGGVIYSLPRTGIRMMVVLTSNMRKNTWG
jgi:F0F1-type ATP synthase assembly protein I